MISPVDLIIRSYCSTPRPYNWSLIEPHIDQWLQGSVDIIKLFRLCLIGKLCLNLTKSYFSLLFQLLHNTTAVTFAYYMKERQWCQMLIAATTNNNTQADLLSHIDQLSDSPIHQQWVHTATSLNKQQYSELVVQLSRAYELANFSSVNQYLYTIYELSFRNGHFTDALAVLLLFKDRLESQYLGLRHNRHDQSHTQLLIQWLILLRIKILDMKQLFSTFYGLTAESVDYFLNFATQSSSTAAKTSFDELNPMKIFRNEYIGNPTSLFDSQNNNPQHNVQKMSLRGGIDELIIPLTLQINHLSAATDQSSTTAQPTTSSSASSQLFPISIQSLSSSISLADSKYGFLSTPLTFSEQELLFSQQIDLVKKFLSVPIQLHCFELLQTSKFSLGLSHAVTDFNSSPSSKFPRDPLLSSAIYLTLAFDSIHKLSQPSFTNRAKKYQQYTSTIMRPWNAALGDSSTSSFQQSDYPQVQQELDPNQPRPTTKSNKSTTLINLQNSTLHQHIRDISPIDALALVPRVSLSMISQWYGFQPYLATWEKTNTSTGDTHTPSTSNPSALNSSLLPSESHVEKFIYDPQFPLISLIFSTFQSNPESFYHFSNALQEPYKSDKPGPLLCLQIVLMSYQSTPLVQTTHSHSSTSILSSPISQTLSSQLFSPSITSTILMKNQPHPLLSISLHDICWLLTVSACTSLHLSQFKQFLNLQQRQYSMLMSFDLVENHQDDNIAGMSSSSNPTANSGDSSSSSSMLASLTNVTFLSSQDLQTQHLKTHDLFPQLLIPPTMTTQYEALLSQLVLAYKPTPVRRQVVSLSSTSLLGSQSAQSNQIQKSPPCPTHYQKPAFLFLYELSGYITCFPYLHTFLSTFHQPTDIPMTPSIFRATQQFPSTTLTTHHHNAPTNPFTHIHFFQYINIYGHFSPHFNTSITGDFSQSIHTRHISIATIIQSLYFNRVLFLLPIYSKLKFSRLILILFGFFTKDTFSQLLHQFTQSASTIHSSTSHDNSINQVSHWFKSFSAFLFIHLTEKKLINAKIAVTDTPITRKTLSSPHSSSYLSPIGVDLYHIETNTFTTPQQNQSTALFKLQSHYTTLQLTKRSLLSTLCKNASINLDIMVTLYSTSPTNHRPQRLEDFISPLALQYISPPIAPKLQHSAKLLSPLNGQDNTKQQAEFQALVSKKNETKSLLFQSWKDFVSIALQSILVVATPPHNAIIRYQQQQPVDMSDLDTEAPTTKNSINDSPMNHKKSSTIFTLDTIDSLTLPSIPPLLLSILQSLYQLRQFYTSDFLQYNIINDLCSPTEQQQQPLAQQKSDQQQHLQSLYLANQFQLYSLHIEALYSNAASTQSITPHHSFLLSTVAFVQSVLTLTAYFELLCVHSQEIIDQENNCPSPSLQQIALRLTSLWKIFTKQLCLVDLYFVTNIIKQIFIQDGLDSNLSLPRHFTHNQFQEPLQYIQSLIEINRHFLTNQQHSPLLSPIVLNPSHFRDYILKSLSQPRQQDEFQCLHLETLSNLGIDL